MDKEERPACAASPCIPFCQGPRAILSASASTLYLLTGQNESLDFGFGQHYPGAHLRCAHSRLSSIPASTPHATAWRWSYHALYLLASWACGLAHPVVAGKVLSKLTLRFIETANPNSTVSPAESVLRLYYRGLINVAGSYYYVSIPFVIFLVLAVTGAIVYGLLALGRVPVKLWPFL